MLLLAYYFSIAAFLLFVTLPCAADVIIADMPADLAAMLMPSPSCHAASAITMIFIFRYFRRFFHYITISALFFSRQRQLFAIASLFIRFSFITFAATLALIYSCYNIPLSP